MQHYLNNPSARSGFRLWYLFILLTLLAGCSTSSGVIALRDAQDLFNEASLETIANYNALANEQFPAASPEKKYEKVVEIVDQKVLKQVKRNDLKVNAYALSAYSHWRLGKYKDAKIVAEEGINLYRAAGLNTNRREYGMLLIVGGLATHSIAYKDYQAKKKKDDFLSPQDARKITSDMNVSLEKIDGINKKINHNEPIAIYANQQQMRIIKNILDVWGDVKKKEDRREPISKWSRKANIIWETYLPEDDYPGKPGMDVLHNRINELREAVSSGHE